jgi:hypothetical protein
MISLSILYRPQPPFGYLIHVGPPPPSGYFIAHPASIGSPYYVDIFMRRKLQASNYVFFDTLISKVFS